MSTTHKTYKKGEFLYKEGDKISNVIFIQSGGVSQVLQRGKKIIDLYQLGSNQILGEGVLIGQPTFPTSAMATTETKTLEITPEALKALIEPAHPSVKLMVKSLVDRLKMGLNETKSSRLSGDAVPCSPEQVPQVYSAIYYTALHKGVKEEKSTKLTLDWQMLRSYSQRVFGQSPKRVEQAAQILVKLKQAEFTMGKIPEDPKGPEVITHVVFYDISAIESFFEFFQYYHYKPGRADLVKYDDFCAQLLEAFVIEGALLTPNRNGVVSVEFNKVSEMIKEKMGITLNNDHFSRLEQKGVLCKRRTMDGGGAVLDFEQKEFNYIFQSWKIIREIDKWNEKGFVDMDEKDEKKTKKAGGPACPQCAAEVVASAKFCQECGAKIVAAA